MIETAVFIGRGWIRPFGVWLPARFVFVHNAGKDYRHYIEAAFFGLPFLKVNEGYLDGASFFESPMGNSQNDPNTNQGFCLVGCDVSTQTGCYQGQGCIPAGEQGVCLPSGELGEGEPCDANVGIGECADGLFCIP